MALTFLVDISVIKRLGRAAVREAVEPLAAAGRLGRAAISDLEVGYSARSAREWDRLMGALDAFDAVETSAGHVRRALQVQRMLAQRSQPRRLRAHGLRHRTTRPVGGVCRKRGHRGARSRGSNRQALFRRLTECM